MQHISQRLLQALGLTGSATYIDARGVNRLPSRAPSEFMHASQGRRCWQEVRCVTSQMV